MKIKSIMDEDFVNYKVPSMVIITSICSFKCEKESGIKCCQNSSLVKQKNITIDNGKIIERYLKNPITKAIVFGGLEPFDQFEDVLSLISELRNAYSCNDDVVVYTGYTFDEVVHYIDELQKFDNIIVKFGRFIPGQKPHYDNVLGVSLASDNQYAKVVGRMKNVRDR